MGKKLAAVLIGLTMALSLGQVAQAVSDNNNGRSGFKRSFQVHGVVSSVGTDSFTVTVTKANGNARRFLAGATEATFSVTESTKYYGAASSFADLAIGDAVKVKARNTETGLTAQRVKEKRA